MSFRICPQCKKPHDSKKGFGKFCSSNCMAKVIKKNAQQLHKKKGPYYERWKKGIQAAVDRL